MARSDLVGELLSMRDIGIAVSDEAISHAGSDDLSQYEAISTGELASLFCELYPVKEVM